MRFNAKQKRALETATWQQHDVEANQATVVSSADGAKILKNLDILANTLDENSSNRSKTFMGDVARAIGAMEKGSSSQYATFETVNGSVVTIRLANHNASSARFDNAGRDNAISIVITNRNNEGVLNDGNAHIVEFYYNKGKLTRADGKPLAEIVRSIKQALYSGDFKDTTGIAERQEVNGEDVIHYQFIGEKGAAEKKKGAENFVTFYTNRKASPSGMQNTQQSAQADNENAFTAAKVGNVSETAKESEGKDRQRYASIGVSRQFGEEAGEGEPRWASWSLSEQQLDGDDTIRFSLRQEPAPKVTKKGYAVFIYKKLKNGGYKLVPKMLSNDPGAPAQTWLNADTGYMKRDENGEPLQNTNGRASVRVNGNQAGGNKSNKLAWRPGKHLAMYPNASQFKSPDGTIPKDVIFFEVEYAADPDLHKQYQRNAWELGMNDNGQYRNNQGGLPYIPKDSYYLYRTNSISEGATPMIITGAYKINRALTDAEAKELNQNAGGMWCPRKGGDLTEEKLKDMGLDDKGLKKMTESFDMDTIKESHDESDEARLLPGYKSREINWEDKDLIHSIEENGQDINDYRDGYVAPEHSEEPTIRFSLDKDKGTVVSPSKPSKAEAVLRDAVIDRLRENGMEVITDVAEGQKVLDEANGDVREMSFGEPYDYEAYPLGRVEPNLADREVMVVMADADHGFMNYKEAKAWAKQHVAKVYNNEETGGKGDVRISNAAIDKFMSQSAVDKSDDKDVHMSVLKVLPEVLKNSIDVETHPDFLKGADGKRRPENGMNKDVLVHRCYGAVSIDGKPYRVKITLKENVKTRETTHGSPDKPRGKNL